MARKDIRSNGKAVPLTHHSARGKVQRNSGNFTRGSQLLTHEMLMWFSGVKLPIVLWFLTFIAAWFLIMSIQLDEHGFQMICMKLYAELWNWVGLSPIKRVNVTLPSGEMLRTIMFVVPAIPEVRQAWAVAMRGLFGSLLISVFLVVPIAIWFVDMSRRRGKTILEERHERGAMLVDFDLLRSEVDQHNHAAFEDDVAELCPGMTPSQVLKLHFVERKARGIHHPYVLAGVSYPHRLEQSHAMLLGTTGAGKTTQLRSLITQMRQRQDTAVVFDLTGAYVEAFYDPERDTILNPMDLRCPAWSIFNDCSTYSHFTSAAVALIPSDGGSSEPFCALAARTLFIEMCMRLIERGQTSNLALAENLMTADLKRVHRTLANTIADPLTAPEAARMAESIRAVFNTNAQVLRFLPDEGEPFSIRQWMTADKAPGSILFVTSDYDDLEMNKPLLTLWMNIAINSLMTLPRTRSLRTWFMFDEVGALHRVPAIEKGLQTARNFGGAMILGLHSFQKLVEVYGEEGARNLSSLARTKLILATGDIKTAEECSHYIGSREVRQMDEAYSYGYNQTRDASTLTARKQVEPLVLPDDITNLPSMHGFVKFPEGFPAARILLQWKAYPKVAEAFLRRAHVEPVRSQNPEDYFADEEAGGRDGAAQIAEKVRDPGNNLAKELAARILDDGVENGHGEDAGKVGEGRGEGTMDGAPGDPVAPGKEEGTEVSRSAPDQAAAQHREGREDDFQRPVQRAAQIEDQSLFELRQDFSGGIGNDPDMGI